MRKRREIIIWNSGTQEVGKGALERGLACLVQAMSCEPQGEKSECQQGEDNGSGSRNGCKATTDPSIVRHMAKESKEERSPQGMRGIGRNPLPEVP